MRSSEQLRKSLERAVAVHSDDVDEDDAITLGQIGNGKSCCYELRWVDGGHATGFIRLEKTFLDAIIDARDRGRQAWKNTDL